MNKFLHNWAFQIILISIIGTLIDMILPESKNKKYIKTVIGILILFCILNPIVGKQIKLEDTIDNYITSQN